MKVHPAEKISRLIEMRRQGSSIYEIMRALSMPKTTVWHHIQKVELSQEIKSLLRSKQGGSRLRKEMLWRRAQEDAKNLLNSKDKHIYTTIACLYWAEGSRRRCEFINTDSRMIELYLRILRQYLKVPESQIQPVLRIFSNHDKDLCLDYWSKVTSIPKNRFQIFLNDGGTHGRGYGMCRIIVLKGGYTLKLFQAIIEQISR